MIYPWLKHMTVSPLLNSCVRGYGIDPGRQGARAILESGPRRDGRLPVNPSGAKVKGHPIGATGVSMHVMAAMQLTGTAGRYAD